MFQNRLYISTSTRETAQHYMPSSQAEFIINNQVMNDDDALMMMMMMLMVVVVGGLTYIVAGEESDRSVWLHSQRYLTFDVRAHLLAVLVNDLYNNHRPLAVDSLKPGLPPMKVEGLPTAGVQRQ